MDENEFRKAYRETQGMPCLFEKIVLTRRCGCRYAQRFNIAEREGVRCEAGTARQDCDELIRLFREQARFALRLTEPGEPLPHGKEIKIQGGGLKGLQRLVDEVQAEGVADIRELIEKTRARFGDFTELPVDEIVRAIAHFQARRSRHT